MLRTHLSWLLVGGVVAVLIAAAIDSLRRSESERPRADGGLAQERGRKEEATEEAPLAAAPETETAPLERCTVGQLALRFEHVGGTPLLALAHVWGSPCRTARIPIEVALFDRNGNPVNAEKASASAWPQAFGSTNLSPGIEVIAEIQMSYLCDERRPRRLLAEARPYVVRAWLPRGYGSCLDDLGP